MDAYQQGYDVHIKYREYRSRSSKNSNETTDLQLVLENVIIKTQVQHRPFCSSSNIPDLLVKCYFSENVAAEFAVLTVDMITLKFLSFLDTSKSVDNSKPQ